MEQRDKLNMTFPQFSVNDKGNVAINNS